MDDDPCMFLTGTLSFYVDEWISVQEEYNREQVESLTLRSSLPRVLITLIRQYVGNYEPTAIFGIIIPGRFRLQNYCGITYFALWHCQFPSYFTLRNHATHFEVKNLLFGGEKDSATIKGAAYRAILWLDPYFDKPTGFYYHLRSWISKKVSVMPCEIREVETVESSLNIHQI